MLQSNIRIDTKRENDSRGNPKMLLNLSSVSDRMGDRAQINKL
jgi:hypothetical protein